MRNDLEECGGVLLRPHTFAVFLLWPVTWEPWDSTVATIAAARPCSRAGLGQRINQLLRLKLIERRRVLPARVGERPQYETRRAPAVAATRRSFNARGAA